MKKPDSELRAFRYEDIAEGQRETGLIVPPDTEVDDLLEAVLCVGELAFVDD